MSVHDQLTPTEEMFLRFRVFGVALLLVAHLLSRIRPGYLASAGTIIIVGGLAHGDDRWTAKKAMALDEKGLEVLGQLETQDLMVRQMNSSHPFAFTGRARTIDLPVAPTEAERKRAMQPVLARLSWKPRRPVEQVVDFAALRKEKTASKKRPSTPAAPSIVLSPKAEALLVDLTTPQYLFDFLEARWRRLHVSSGGQKSRTKKEPIRVGLAKEAEIFLTSNYGKLLYATDAGWAHRNKTNPLPGRGRELHRLCIGAGCRWAKKNGYSYAVEAEIGQHRKRIDLLLRDKLGLETIGMECGLSSAAQELKNAIDDFAQPGGVDRLIIACRDLLCDAVSR